ncbi:hypothetical protein [Methylomonas methanica]|uniref:Uncharacterized protein n=1 Tax=Methylomonas methanica (strain DSM 25384 / MC09) TaxID=857087 RepID=G0A6Q9_METMM|nr:hypothetical protein [Methylomonas methanica]AEG00530.1 hypothetical protein Metme_2125 [Methylomonas methanica MC09]
MAFKNEKISEQDIAKFDAVINYENLRKHARYISRFYPSSHHWWTLDREKDAYVIRVVGGGREQLDYYALVIEGQPVVFNVDDQWEGNDSVGIHAHWNVYDLCIPEELKPRRQEIKQLIREGLEEKAFCRPFADGGTVDNPNTLARGNVVSFEVEFK